MPDMDLYDLKDRIPLPPGVSRRRSPKRRKPGRTRSLLSAGFILLMLGIIGFSIYQVTKHITVGLNTLRTQDII